MQRSSASPTVSCSCRETKAQEKQSDLKMYNMYYPDVTATHGKHQHWLISILYIKETTKASAFYCIGCFTVLLCRKKISNILQEFNLQDCKCSINAQKHLLSSAVCRHNDLLTAANDRARSFFSCDRVTSFLSRFLILLCSPFTFSTATLSSSLALKVSS